jgi:hypothetical protein
MSGVNDRQSVDALYMLFERPIKDSGPNLEKVEKTIAVQIRPVPLDCAERRSMAGVDGEILSFDWVSGWWL